MPYRRYRSKDDHSYSIGVFPTIELLQNRPDTVERVLLSTKGYRNEGLKIISAICSEKCIETVIADSQIGKLANDKTYAIGVFRKFDTSISRSEDHIVLVRPKHQGNLGTILRTMVGFEFHDLAIVGEAADIFNPDTIRASMGACFRMNVSMYRTIDDYTDDHPGHHLYPFMTEGKESLGTIEFKQPYSLVFGNEGEGLPEIFARLGISIRIEQADEIDSLNLAVSAGIAMYVAKKGTG